MERGVWTGGPDEEYETQHFGFGAQRLKISIRQMIEEKIRNGVNDLESYLKESLDLNDKDKATLSRACDRVLRLYYARAKPSLCNIDNEIDRILKIPSNVLLPADEVQKQQVTEKEHNDLIQEVDNLRKRIKRSAMMEALLMAQEKEISSIGSVCEVSKKDMEALDLLFKDFASGDSTKIATNDTGFLIASAPFMNIEKESVFEE